MDGGDIKVFPSANWPTFSEIRSMAVINNTLLWTWSDGTLREGGISMLDTNTAAFLGNVTLRDVGDSPIPYGRFLYLHISLLK